jgi:hypothetical protein
LYGIILAPYLAFSGRRVTPHPPQPKPSLASSEAKPRVLNESPVDKQGFPKTSEVEFRGFLRDPEVTEPAGETGGIRATASTSMTDE